MLGLRNIEMKSAGSPSVAAVSDSDQEALKRVHLKFHAKMAEI